MLDADGAPAVPAVFDIHPFLNAPFSLRYLLTDYRKLAINEHEHELTRAGGERTFSLKLLRHQEGEREGGRSSAF